MLSLSLSSSSPSSSAAAANYHQPSTINNKHFHHCHHRSQVLLAMASSTCSKVVLKAMDGTTVNLPATGWTVNSHWNGLCIFNCSLDSNTYLPPSERTLKRGNRFNIHHNNSKVSIKISDHNRVQKWDIHSKGLTFDRVDCTTLIGNPLKSLNSTDPWCACAEVGCLGDVGTHHTFLVLQAWNLTWKPKYGSFGNMNMTLFIKRKCVVCWQVSGERHSKENRRMPNMNSIQKTC